MKAIYFSILVSVISMSVSQVAFSQTVILDCLPDTFSVCVNDPGVSLPDNNQLLVGVGSPGATSCSVHLTQSRTISSTCGGTILYGVALIVDDTVQYLLQDIIMVTLDSLGFGVLTFDTRNADDATIRTNGLPYNEGCSDHYEIQWYVSDECGDEDYCEEFVQLYDCQKPTIDNSSSLYILQVPLGCVIQTNAAGFSSNILDDCSAENAFVYSFDSLTFRPDTSLYPNDIEALGVELPFGLWVADEGRDNNCDGQIAWIERNIYKKTISVVYTEIGSGCFEPHIEDYVSGKVTTQDYRPIAEVAVNMTSPGHVYPTYVTSGDGEYLFNHVVTPVDVTITGYRNDNHKNGVSTLDLVKIQKHLLGIEPVTNPYTILAMDANCSQNVSAIDLIELRKLILGINTELPFCQSWRFIDKKFDFNDPSYPWPNPSAITLSLTGSVEDADFIGIKIGDVNNTVIANLQQPLPRSSNAIVKFEVNDQSYKASDIIDIPVALKSDASVLGFQFTLSSSDLEFINVRSGVVTVDENEFNVADNDLTMSWFSLDPIKVISDDKLFTLQARAKRSGNLKSSLRISSDITEAELYDGAETTYEPVLSVQSTDEVVSLLPLSPNPASDYVTVAYYVPEGTAATIQFTSLDNKLVLSRGVTATTGRNEVKFPCNQLVGGLLMCTLQSAAGISTQKVMVVK